MLQIQKTDFNKSTPIIFKYSILFTIVVLISNIFNTKATPPKFHNILKNQLQQYYFQGDYDSCRYVYKEFIKTKAYYTSDLERLTAISITMQDTVNAIAFFKELLIKTENDTTILSLNPKISVLKTYPQYKQIEQEYDSLKLYYFKNFNRKLSQRILEMYVQEQYVRIKLPKSCKDEIGDKIDHDNYDIIKRIVNDFGFPTISQIGEEAWKGLYILLMHSSTLSEQHFQYVDSLMRKQVDFYILESWRYANMVDRYLHFNGKPQRYGTFSVRDEDNSLTSGEIFEPENLDTRRYEMGLYSFISFAQDLKLKKIPDTYKYIDPLQFYFENK